jgi:hypothetical protein
MYMNIKNFTKAGKFPVKPESAKIANSKLY